MAQGALKDGAGRRSAKTRGARRAVVSAMVAGLTFLAAACGPRNTEVGAMATGASKTTFTVPGGRVSGATRVSFRMDFVGSSSSPVSEEITVLPGDTVMLVVPPR